jgi:flavorubredoxin
MEANSTLVNIDEQTAPKLVAFVSSLIDEEGEGKGNELLETGNKLIDNRDTKGLIYLILNHSEKIISAEIESGN